jgi:hypothetical protein
MRSALLFSIGLVLATAPSGIGAEVRGSGSPADSAVVLSDATLWRDFVVPRCFYVRMADGTLEPWDFVLRDGGWLLLRAEPAGWTAPRVPFPAGWTGPTLDDSGWTRVRLPQRAPHGRRPHMQGAFSPTLLIRGEFEVQDPARVKSCRLSLQYWGGVVVYLNGKEAARAHVQTNRTPGQAVAETYPKEAWISVKGKPLSIRSVEDADGLALRDRKLEAQVPSGLLRRGLNVLAVEVHAAPIDSRVFDEESDEWSQWPPIGLLSARMTVSPGDAVVGNVSRPPEIQVWNCASYDTIGAFDYGDPTEPLRPVAIRAARNGVFSGRLMVSSPQAIKGLDVSVTDLANAGGGGWLSSTAVRVRCAAPAEPGKTWVPRRRFDGLFDTIPAVIPVAAGPSQEEIDLAEDRFFHWRFDRYDHLGSPGAVAPLWFTVRVPKDAEPGLYEGTVTVAAEGLAPTDVPLQVSVSAWRAPDPGDFRVHNFAHHSPDSIARHYGVPLWSDEHLELMGQSLALAAEVGARRVYANLAVEYFGDRFAPSNAESLVRWIKQPDGSYKHDFTVFDKYLDMVAKSVGEPFPLQLNCWGDPGPIGGWGGVRGVSVLDPVTGKIDCMEQPPLGTEASYEFWRPVFDGILKKLEARGWLKVTVLGWNAVHGGPPEDVKEVARRLWPNCDWSTTSHDTKEGLFQSNVYFGGHPEVRGYRVLLKPRGRFTTFWGGRFGEGASLIDCRRIIEDMIMSGHDGLGRFGWDLFPFRNPRGGYDHTACGWPRNPRDTTGLAVVYPGPDGQVATERYEMFREGVQLCEALLFIERAIEGDRLSPGLRQRAERDLEARDRAFINDWFPFGVVPSPEEDAKLLDLAGEVANRIQ